MLGNPQLIRFRKRSSEPEKKLPDILAEIDRQWLSEGPIRLMFQDEARFGRISDTRRCGCPKPVRPLCQAMVVQEYSITK